MRAAPPVSTTIASARVVGGGGALVTVRTNEAKSKPIAERVASTAARAIMRPGRRRRTEMSVSPPCGVSRRARPKNGSRQAERRASGSRRDGRELDCHEADARPGAALRVAASEDAIARTADEEVCDSLTAMI